MRRMITILTVAAALAAGSDVEAGVRPDKSIDVYTIAESGTTSFGGSWKIEKRAITGTAASGGRLEIPLEISGSYELSLSIWRLSGKGFFGVRFPVGARSLALTLFANNGREDSLEGTWRSEGIGKTSATPSVIKADKRHRIRITVLQRRNRAKVTVTADGKDHLSWQGDTSKICPAEIWGDTRAKTLSLGLWNGSVRFDSLWVRLTAGRHRVRKARRRPKPKEFNPKRFRQGLAVGAGTGAPFRDVKEKDGLLVGLSFRYSEKAGLVTLIPIFKTKEGIVYGQRHGGRQYPDELAQILLAPEGFALGGLVAKPGPGRPIACIKAVFMKIKNGDLDPKQSYESEAYGARSTRRAVLLGGSGRAGTGIEGKSGSTIDQLALVFR